MKQVNLTIHVPDNKFDKLMEFLSKNFGTITINQADDFDVVPEWHKEIVLNRIKTAKEKDFFPLDELDSKIDL